MRPGRRLEDKIRGIILKHWPRALISHVETFKRDDGDTSMACRIDGFPMFLSAMPRAVRTGLYKLLNT